MVAVPKFRRCRGVFGEETEKIGRGRSCGTRERKMEREMLAWRRGKKEEERGQVGCSAPLRALLAFLQRKRQGRWVTSTAWTGLGGEARGGLAVWRLGWVVGGPKGLPSPAGCVCFSFSVFYFYFFVERE